MNLSLDELFGFLDPQALSAIWVDSVAEYILFAMMMIVALIFALIDLQATARTYIRNFLLFSFLYFVLSYVLFRYFP